LIATSSNIVIVVITVVGPSSDAVLREQSKRGQNCLGIFLLIFSIVLIAITFPVAICLSLKVCHSLCRFVNINFHGFVVDALVRRRTILK